MTRKAITLLINLFVRFLFYFFSATGAFISQRRMRRKNRRRPMSTSSNEITGNGRKIRWMRPSRIENQTEE